MAISATFDTGGRGPESRRSSRKSELWKITGAAGIATDTVAITPRYIARNAKCVGGGFSYATSGAVITLTALVALGSGVCLVEIIGD